MATQQISRKRATGTGREEQRWRIPAVCIFLAAITFAVFGRTMHHDFINFDDNDYVYDNPIIVQGLTFKGILWAFTNVYSCNWHPLTWISHMVDCQLYGLHPGGHHLTNILFHAATVIALFLVLRQLTGAFWRSAFVAAIFAVHPLRVESVAWVAERKDLLSGLFFMLTIGAYARYARLPWSVIRYGVVLLLFAVGLMCKPMLVTLPLVLLLLDYWPLRRAESPARLLLEKLPFLALTAVSCIATLLEQTKLILPTGATLSLPLRLANALVACMIYLRQMVWPESLALLYPYPYQGLPTWEVALAGMLVAGLSALAFWQRRKQPWLLIGWLWYLVMLLPVMGIIQVGRQAHADRYTYLPQIGVYLAVTWLVAAWGARWQSLRAAFAWLMPVVVAVLMICAWRQTAYWQNSETVWSHTITCTKPNDVPHTNLGFVFLQKGRLNDAIAEYQTALQLNPDVVEAHYNLGISLLRTGRTDDAISHFQSALKLKPAFAEAQLTLGEVLLQQGRVDEAISHLQSTLQINPANAEAHLVLGNVLMDKGQLDEAIAHFQKAALASPDNAQAENNLGNALMAKGQLDEAISHFQRALQLRPDYAKASVNLNHALQLKAGAPSQSSFPAR